MHQRVYLHTRTPAPASTTRASTTRNDSITVETQQHLHSGKDAQTKKGHMLSRLKSHGSVKGSQVHSWCLSCCSRKPGPEGGLCHTSVLLDWTLGLPHPQPQRPPCCCAAAAPGCRLGALRAGDSDAAAAAVVVVPAAGVAEGPKPVAPAAACCAVGLPTGEEPGNAHMWRSVCGRSCLPAVQHNTMTLCECVTILMCLALCA